MKKKEKIILIVGIVILIKNINKKFKTINARIDGCYSKVNRVSDYLSIYAKIINSKDKGLGLSEKLESMGVKTIAVYGKGTLGDLVGNELENSSIHIAYYIDKYVQEDTYKGVPIFSLDTVSEMKPVDLILVTPVHLFNYIIRDLYLEGRDEKILSLKELI